MEDENKMKYIMHAIIICSIFVTSQVYSKTEQDKLTYGYNGVKWGTDLSKNTDFISVQNTWLQLPGAVAYESKKHKNVILEGKNMITAEKLLFICIKGKFAVVPIVVKSGQNDEVPQSFFFLAHNIKNLYGEPTSGSISTTNEIFYKKKSAWLKIQFRKGKNVQLIIYAPKYEEYMKQ